MLPFWSHIQVLVSVWNFHLGHPISGLQIKRCYLGYDQSLSRYFPFASVKSL